VNPVRTSPGIVMSAPATLIVRIGICPPAR
jgi:hypothetical protein